MKKNTALVINLIFKLLKYAIILALILLVIVLILLSSAYHDFKSAGQNALSAKNELSLAVLDVKNRNWEEALNKTELANEKIATALDNLQKTRSNPAVEHFSIINKQINDLEYLFETTEILSKSMKEAIPIAASLDKIYSGKGENNFTNLSSLEKAKFFKLIYESEPEINGIKANLALAALNLEKIHKIGILWPYYKQISEIKSELETANYLIAKLSPLTQLLPALAGYPSQSRFLLILQNNDELRPSGGFIGTYGILESKNGEIVYLKTDDSYHLDMPSVGLWKMQAPAPISKYMKVENWYFRDANWSPDWPTSAKKIEEIYQGENKAIGQIMPPSVGVIAINPELVADFIRLVGPITVRGESYNAENLQQLLQYNVEVAYKEQDISSWNRKEIINELLAELKNRLFNLPTSSLGSLLGILDQNINEKNIQIYFTDKNWESLINRLGADGKVKDTDGDYLMVVDANLAAYKSDAAMKKNISYEINQENFQVQVKLNYQHTGDFDWRTTRYRSYTRIYTPLGSKLISLQGINETQNDFSVSEDTLLNKTVFGFFFSIEPGESRDIIINYALPDELKENMLQKNQYNLYWQKQAGNYTNARVSNKNNIIWQGELRTDKSLIFNLNR